MKPLGIKNYGSIPHLSISKLGAGDHYINKGQEDILTLKKRDKHDNILVFEKYDGSNVGIAKIDNNIYPITRSGYAAKTSRYVQHHYFDKWVQKRRSLFMDLLKNGERIVGEWMAQAHGITYTIKYEPIVFFDFFNDNNERLLFNELKLILDKYGLQPPRKLHEGEALSVKELLPILNKRTDEIRSNEMPEGMVFRVERNGGVDFLAKYVRNDFEPGKYCVNTNDFTWNYNINKI